MTDMDPLVVPEPPTRFEDQIVAYEQRDRTRPPIPNPLLFVGSSTFTRWHTLAEDFPEFPAINRGFGGSTFNDLLYYMDRIVLPYRPRGIVVYEGTNDIALGFAPQLVAERFSMFATRVWQTLPDIHIHFLSGLVSPGRRNVADRTRKANALIRQRTETDPRLHYIDAHNDFLTPAGEPDEQLFEPDTIHPNRAGYDRFIPILRNALSVYRRTS